MFYTSIQEVFIVHVLHLFPRNQVDMLSEINIAPRILTNFTGVMPSQFKKDLDSYLKTRSPVTFLSELRSNLQVQYPSLNLVFDLGSFLHHVVLRSHDRCLQIFKDGCNHIVTHDCAVLEQLHLFTTPEVEKCTFL